MEFHTLIVLLIIAPIQVPAFAWYHPDKFVPCAFLDLSLMFLLLWKFRHRKKMLYLLFLVIHIPIILALTYYSVTVLHDNIF